MTSDPKGNIMSFCSEDGLCWLIQLSNYSVGVFIYLFVYLYFFSLEKKESVMSQGGFKAHWKSKFREKLMFYWFLSRCLETISRVNISLLSLCLDLELHPTVQGVSPEVSCISINKVIRWARHGSGRILVPGFGWMSCCIVLCGSFDIAHLIVSLIWNM